MRPKNTKRMTMLSSGRNTAQVARASPGPNEEVGCPRHGRAIEPPAVLDKSEYHNRMGVLVTAVTAFLGRRISERLVS